MSWSVATRCCTSLLYGRQRGRSDVPDTAPDLVGVTGHNVNPVLLRYVQSRLTSDDKQV